jgi:predicted glycosyltransferase
VRALIDLTNSPHVPFFAPLTRRLEARGWHVTVTARRFAQTVELAAMHGLNVTVIGAHGGGGRVGKARAAAARTAGLWRFARSLHRREPFDVALSHGSTDLPLVARWLDVPHVTIFDYEWARTMHRLNVASSWKAVTPDAIPAERLDRYGAAGKLEQYPGLKEEYYLADARINEDARADLGVAAGDVLAVLRPPPDLALYHRGHSNEVFGQLLDRIAAADGASAVVLARTSEQGAQIAHRHAAQRSVIVPEHAVDAPSLLVAADVVVSAGGTMNREAVALGVPVHTVFAGRLGGVDEQLLASGRMHQLASADDIQLVRREHVGARPPLRDPNELLDLILHGLPTR